MNLNALCFVYVLLFAGSVICKNRGGIYSYKVRNYKGKIVSLEQYRGMVSLVVNVASECGYTDEHYKQLTQLQSELAEEKKEPFTVLGFPCNQFGNQEPYDNEAIQKFAKDQYDSNFPIFHKIDVIGNDIDAVYGFLARESGQEPTWNFWKYLIDPDGSVIGSWGPRTSVIDIKSDILDALEEAKHKYHSEL